MILLLPIPLVSRAALSRCVDVVDLHSCPGSSAPHHYDQKGLHAGDNLSCLLVSFVTWTLLANPRRADS